MARFASKSVLANMYIRCGGMNMRAAIYLRVSTDEQTTDNQERELRAAAERIGHEIVAVYRDAGISGSKGRDQRPGFDAMHKDAARRRFDVVMAWSVDRLGRINAGAIACAAFKASSQSRSGSRSPAFARLIIF
jgi:DNA invertase Pin-like site-specific DNA recombinase